MGALDPGIQQYLDQIAGLSSRLSGPTQLLELDEGTKAAFAAQSAAEQGKLKQQFEFGVTRGQDLVSVEHLVKLPLTNYRCRAGVRNQKQKIHKNDCSKKPHTLAYTTE